MHIRIDPSQSPPIRWTTADNCAIFGTTMDLCRLEDGTFWCIFLYVPGRIIAAIGFNGISLDPKDAKEIAEKDDLPEDDEDDEGGQCPMSVVFGCCSCPYFFTCDER